MANVLSNQPKPPYKFQEYPKNLHKGEYPNIVSKTAKSASEQKALEAEGFSIDRPAIPEPEPIKQTLSVEERVTALEYIVNSWRQQDTEAAASVRVQQQAAQAATRKANAKG